ncbi:MAG TPA: hypothetical protein ENH19_03425 [Actinobacteria bacterium]|nr:hypothetical protein [Actinomycetes bacterium]HEX21685.1 hypothetical protein [Actinomycetota bacterium]
MNESDRIVGFLRALDAKLSKKTAIYIIGGSAITLAYSPDNRTSDIDIVGGDKELERFGGMNSDLAKAHGVYISKVYDISFSAPTGWRQRCKKLGFKLINISVFVADPYDIVLGKLARLEPKDIDDIQSLEKGGFIEPDVLILRLNDNIKEIERNEAYRKNALLLFSIAFNQSIVFKNGKAKKS